eukprot:g1419.t1
MSSAKGTNIELNQLTTIWGAEPRPGELTYTRRGGKRVQSRPTINDLRAPTVPGSSRGKRKSTAAGLFAISEGGQGSPSSVFEAATPQSGGPVASREFGGAHPQDTVGSPSGQSETPSASAGEPTATAAPDVASESPYDGPCACLVPKPVKFGMWDGVFARCLLNIFGVIMFLRVPWLVAYAGLYETVLVMLISVCITTISSLSLSAICTNGEIKGGGAYYLISRALGPEFGGAIGIMFYIGNAIGVAMYHIGFAETVVALVGGTGGGAIIADGWDSRIFALIALAIVQVVCVTSIALVVKIQLGLLALLVVSIVTFFVGCFMEHPELQAFSGPVGSSASQFQKNLFSDYSLSQVYAGNQTCRHPLDPTNKPGNWTAMSTLVDVDGTVNFGVALGIFFPAVTGIMAGANISGDLKDPSSAIPFGTNLSIAVSTVVYLILALFVALVSIRSVPGILSGEDCPFGGSFHDYVIMARIAAWPPIVYAGIFASTISSGIASLVGAPRILQAVAADNIFPGIGCLAKTFGPNEEPIAGYIFTCAIAVFSIIALDLNSVAPLITNFFMCSYALTNFACFMADLSRSPLVLVSFEMLNEAESESTSTSAGELGRRNKRVNTIVKDEDGIPVAMVDNVSMAHRIQAMQSDATMSLFLLAKDLKKGHGLLVVGNVLETERERLLEDGEDDDAEEFPSLNGSSHASKQSNNSTTAKILVPTIIRSDSFDSHKADSEPVSETKIKIERRTSFASQRKPHENLYIEKQKCVAQMQQLLDLVRVPAFPTVVRAPSVYDGATSLMQIGGLGSLKTNTLVMSFPKKWYMSTDKRNADFVSILGDAFDNEYGVVILRSKGRDYAASRDEEDSPMDVWWNADDGGLTLLLPHLIQRSAAWRRHKSQMRVVSTLRPEDLASSAAEIARIKKLVEKFRIGASVKHVLLDDLDSPGAASWNRFVKRHAGASSASRMTEHEERIAKERVRMGEIIADES